MERATVVIGLDGTQKLPAFDERGEERGKQEAFYQVLQELCRLVNQDACPFVVACVTATQNVSQAMADSPQARQYLKLPRVTAVTRQQVAAIPEHPLKDLLTMDMGGHGRALECLEESLKVMPGAGASALVGAVISRLSQKYPDAVHFDGASSEDFLDLLRASLSGKVLHRNQTVGRLDPAKMELIRVVYFDELVTEYRIDIPYIWLQLMLTQQTLTSDLGPWKLLDYDLFEKPSARTWQAWEHFNAEFRVLRSCSFEDGQVVDIGSLHRGAIIKPPDFERQKVVNRRLTLAKAKSRLSSRASCCGHPNTNSTSSDTSPAKGLNKFECHVTLAGKDAVVLMADKKMLVINAAAAPGADAFLTLDARTAGNEELISERLQFKMGSSGVNVTQERSKACDKNDILVVELAGAERDGRAAQLAGAALRGQDLLPRLRHLALRPEQVQEDLVGGAGQPLAAVLPPKSLHPHLKRLGVFRQLADDAVRLARHSHKLRMHGNLRATPPAAPEVARPELAVPLAPAAELGHRRLPAL